MTEFNFTCCSLNTFFFKFLFMLILKCYLQFPSKLVFRLSPVWGSFWDLGFFYSGEFRKLRILIFWKFIFWMVIKSIIIDTILNFPLFYLFPFISYVNLWIYSFVITWVVSFPYLPDCTRFWLNPNTLHKLC